MSDNATTVRDFLAAWGETEADLFAAMRRYLTAGAVWENVGMSTTTGPEEAIAFLGKYLSAAKLATFRVEIVNIAAAGDVVFVERVDRAVTLDGQVRGKGVRVCAVFEVRDGAISAWRDYFDTAPHKH